MAINLNFEKTNTIANSFNKYRLSSAMIESCLHSSYIRYEGGVPITLTMSKDSLKSVAIDHTDSHTIVFGSTGSKKTRLVVMPTVKILGVAGESMIINDTKGEIYHRFENELSERGYQIIVLDLRDTKRGNCWNPLAIPYEMYLKGDIDKATELVNDIATNLMVGKTSTSQNIDPYWNYSAADCFFGLALLLFKFCKEHDEPKANVNISNLLLLRRKLFTGSSYRKEHDEDLWKYAQEDDVIAASLSGTITALERTKASILSIFDQNMRTFIIQPTLLDMLSRTDFAMESIIDQKTALFLITPDEKSSYHRLVSLFVKQSYEYLMSIAMQNLAGKVNIRLNYILDEFGALPAITDMNSMVAAARSRDIRFLLVTQSKHQLIEHYGDGAQTIISNCNNWIFLTSREVELLQELSQLCGDNERKMPNLSVFDLQHFDKEKGEALLLCGRYKPCKINLPDIDEYYQTNSQKNKIEFVAAREVPLRVISQSGKVDFILSKNEKKRLHLIDGEDDDDDDFESHFDETESNVKSIKEAEQNLKTMRAIDAEVEKAIAVRTEAEKAIAVRNEVEAAMAELEQLDELAKSQDQNNNKDDKKLEERNNNTGAEKDNNSDKLLVQLYWGYFVASADLINNDDARIAETISECTNLDVSEDDSEFEEICMDVIEKIVSISCEQNRDGAIRESAKYLIAVRRINPHEKLINIHKRVLYEFIISTDEEYNLLRKQIFKS